MYTKYKTFGNRYNILLYTQKWMFNETSFELPHNSYVQVEVLKGDSGYYTQDQGRYQSYVRMFNQTMNSTLGKSGLKYTMTQYSTPA